VKVAKTIFLERDFSQKTPDGMLTQKEPIIQIGSRRIAALQRQFGTFAGRVPVEWVKMRTARLCSG
jgi:hypothetical protein